MHFCSRCGSTTKALIKISISLQSLIIIHMYDLCCRNHFSVSIDNRVSIDCVLSMYFSAQIPPRTNSSSWCSALRLPFSIASSLSFPIFFTSLQHHTLAWCPHHYNDDAFFIASAPPSAQRATRHIVKSRSSISTAPGSIRLPCSFRFTNRYRHAYEDLQRLRTSNCMRHLGTGVDWIYQDALQTEV
jgi:hypothetical protein